MHCAPSPRRARLRSSGCPANACPCLPPLVRHGADELDALWRITQRRTRAEREWRDEIRRLFTGGHSIDQIAAAAGVRYEVVVAIVRPT